MEKKEISRDKHRFLIRVLELSVNEEIISHEQSERVLAGYAPRKGISFVRAVLVFGAILVGLGVLSFIASNWNAIGRPVRYGLIIFFYLATNFTSFKLSAYYPKTSRSLLYLSTLIFGAGIFLVGQMFHLGGSFTVSFLLWSVGILPAALIFRDEFLYVAADLFLIVYVIGYSTSDGYPLLVIPAILVVYYCNKLMGYSGLITFFNNALLFVSVGFIAARSSISGVHVIMLLFAIGAGMAFLPLKRHRKIYEFQGLLAAGTAGVMLTFPEWWRGWAASAKIASPEFFAWFFAAVFILALLLLIKKEKLLALVFMGIIIFRYYVDLTYDFLPKSFVFISGGLLLLGFGFLIERSRHKKGGGGIAR